ncbi:MAG TPA: hypothetical protein VMI54_03140 [Polyangiaceae bacterium]|nr:hypothetical protein [Polyangiaceae bacterium]
MGGFIPQRHVALDTRLSVEEVVASLSRAVAPQGTRDSRRLFRGTVAEHGFELRRVIAYRNSFLPRIHGTIDGRGEKTRVALDMRLESFTQFFMGFWLLATVGGEFVTIGGALTGRLPAIAVLAPAVMFVFGWLLANVAFSYEANEAERSLTVLIRTRPPRPRAERANAGAADDSTIDHA